MPEKEGLIFETKSWFVVLAEEQTYLGYCIVVLKRGECGDLADVTPEELLDFLQVVKKFEAALRKAFDVTMFNWSCLMNNAYQVDPPAPHVHWHVKPRYDHAVEFEGEIFEDPNFGNHYALLENLSRRVDQDMQKKIIVKIRENLPL